MPSTTWHSLDHDVTKPVVSNGATLFNLSLKMLVIKLSAELSGLSISLARWIEAFFNHACNDARFPSWILSLHLKLISCYAAKLLRIDLDRYLILQILSNPDRVTREKKQVTFLTKSTANFAIHLYSLQIKFVPSHLCKVSRPKCHAKADKNILKNGYFHANVRKTLAIKKGIDRNRLQKIGLCTYT